MMLERDITQEPVSDASVKRISRRKFLKLSGGATGAALGTIAGVYPLATEVASSLLGSPEADALAAQGLACNVISQLAFNEEHQAYRREFGISLINSLIGEYNSHSDSMATDRDFKKWQKEFNWFTWKTLRLVATYELNTLLQDTWENKYAVSAPGTLKRPPEKIKIPGKAYRWEDIYNAISATICTLNNPLGRIRVNLEASGKGMTKNEWKSDRGERWPEGGYCWGVVVKPPYAYVRDAPSSEGRKVNQLREGAVVTMTKRIEVETATWHETPRPQTISPSDKQWIWFFAPEIVFISGDVVTPTYFLPPKL